MNRILIATACAAVCLAACTQQKPNTYRLEQQLENFAVAEEINTRIDLLWVIDNSASMDVSQDKLRRGFDAFARKYLRPNWDVRIATLTTDAYMAHPAFRTYLRTAIDGTTHWASPYISSRLDSFVNPPWSPSLVNRNTGEFTHGITYNDQVPSWGPDYARLLPGKHDGPIAALCTEKHPYFFYGESQCRIRDDQTRSSGPTHCLNPATGESSITQCVNTVENDTIHSGHPILSTLRPTDGPAPDEWISSLIQDFLINASVGTSGSGSERGFDSLLQLLQDNEDSDTAFFRPRSHRIIVFLSDEDDQSLVIPANPDSSFTPFSGYSGSCPAKNVDGFTYRLTSCPNPDQLVPIASVKDNLDHFFRSLDRSADSEPAKYLIVPIVATTRDTIQALQKARNPVDQAAGNPGDIAVDRGDRYLALADAVGNGSFALDIGSQDYSAILDTIGRAIVQRKSSFDLRRAPTGTDDMIVTIAHADGTRVNVPSSQYTVSGTTLTLTDLNFVLSLSSTDRIFVSYQPKTVY